MRHRHRRPGPEPSRPSERPALKAPADPVRKERVLALKARIRRGLYDADGKMDGILEAVLRDAC